MMITSPGEVAFSLLRRHSAPGGDHERDRRVRERSLYSDDKIRRFRHLEAPEEQPEGEQDDLERCDGNDKDAPP